MSIDPFLPFSVYPAATDECYVVRGTRVGAFVEISMSRDSRRRHRFRSDSYVPVETLAIKRFAHSDAGGYMAYASKLEDAARCAARGELGYGVHTVADDRSVRVSLVARLIGPDGHVETEISDEHRFEDPDSQAALIQANEKAAELSERAQELNDEWASSRRARLLDLRAEYEKSDALAEAAEDLHRIVDSERD